MQTLELGLGLIKQNDHYILQMRDHLSSRGANNLVGVYGGKLNPGEVPLAGTIREISEETNLLLSPESAVTIGKVDVLSDHDSKPARVRGHAYMFEIASGVTIESHEGTLMRYTEQDVFRNRFILTPATRALFDRYFFKDTI